MVKIIYIPHATTSENELGIASGHSMVGLAPQGIKHATDLQGVFKTMHFDAAYTSDLSRTVETIELALKYNDVTIVKDARLREVNYGDYTGRPRDEVRDKRLEHLHTPYPNGESYDEVLARVQSFLDDLKNKHDKQTVAICGHGVYPLEVLINKMPIEKALFDWVDADYRTFEF